MFNKRFINIAYERYLNVENVLNGTFSKRLD